MLQKKFNELFFPHDHKPEHVKVLDGLRGIAVLLVLLSHSSNSGIFLHPYLNFHGVGKVGVYLFFVLSAYLLDRQIALAFMRSKSSKRYWSNYFLRRFLRIYPLFFLALLIYGLLSFAGFPTSIDRAKDIPLHMLLLSGESIFWSIPVEFKYYFISPLIMWFCHKVLKWNITKLIITFSTVVIISIVLTLYFDPPTYSTLRYLPIFIIGTYISIYELLLHQKNRNPIRSGKINLLAFLGFTFLFISIPFYFEQFFGFNPDFHSPIFYVPYAASWGVLLLASKYGRGFTKKVTELKFLRFIGSISFSMYLFHMLFLYLVIRTDIPQGLKIYIFFLLTILASSISYLFIERPLSKISISQKD